MDVLGPSLEIPLYDLLGKRGAVIIASATAQANQRLTANVAGLVLAWVCGAATLGPCTVIARTT